MKSCAHLEQVKLETEGKQKDVKSVKRLDLTGSIYDYVYHVVMLGCCDSSPNKHGTKHFKSTSHPVIKSYEPGENWKWCYVDEIFMK